jgi:hypothetical protein
MRRFVIATKSHRETLVQRLAEEGFDVGWAIQDGVYTSLDAADMLSTIMVNGSADRLLFFESLCGLIESAAKVTKTEHPRAAICGECVVILLAEGNVNGRFGSKRYPLSSFHREQPKAYEHVCAQHTTVYSR